MFGLTGERRDANSGLRAVQIPENVVEVVAMFPAWLYPPNDLSSASGEEVRVCHV